MATPWTRRRLGNWNPTNRPSEYPLYGWELRGTYSRDPEEMFPVCEMCLTVRPRHRSIMAHAEVDHTVDVGCECALHMVTNPAWGDDVNAAKREQVEAAMEDARSRASRIDRFAEKFVWNGDPIDPAGFHVWNGVRMEIAWDGAWSASAVSAVSGAVLERQSDLGSKWEALGVLRDRVVDSAGKKLTVELKLLLQDDMIRWNEETRQRAWEARQRRNLDRGWRLSAKGHPRLYARKRCFLIVPNGAKWKIRVADRGNEFRPGPKRNFASVAEAKTFVVDALLRQHD